MCLRALEGGLKGGLRFHLLDAIETQLTVTVFFRTIINKIQIYNIFYKVVRCILSGLGMSMGSWDPVVQQDL